MRETLSRADVEAALRKQAEDLTAKAGDLRELDAAIQEEPAAWHFWSEADRFFCR